jgi:response regulator of citrate/malate metabolism
MLKEKQPEKLHDSKILHLLNNLNTMEDVLKINEVVSDSSNKNSKNNQQLKNYDKKTVLRLLQYQNKHNLSASFMSKKYKMSRTTIAKWWKMFGNEVQ